MQIVDTHVHIGRDHYEPVEMLLAQMELNGVSKTVLVQSTATLDNSYVLECRQRFPGRLAVVCRVDVDDPAAPDTLEGSPRRRRRDPAHPQLPPVARQ